MRGLYAVDVDVDLRRIEPLLNAHIHSARHGLGVTLDFFTTGMAFAQESEKPSGQEVTVTGEVLDMSCYIDHGAIGEKHAACAKKCIASGLPVGIKANDGKTYLLIGDHKPANAELADDAAKTITVKGKAVSRDGINMIENAVVQK